MVKFFKFLFTSIIGSVIAMVLFVLVFSSGVGEMYLLASVILGVSLLFGLMIFSMLIFLKTRNIFSAIVMQGTISIISFLYLGFQEEWIVSLLVYLSVFFSYLYFYIDWGSTSKNG